MASRLSEYVSARVSPEVMERIQKMAEQREWSLSKVVAKLIEKGLAKK
jgi:predicted HicB family RNase H-like nuclease